MSVWLRTWSSVAKPARRRAVVLATFFAPGFLLAGLASAIFLYMRLPAPEPLTSGQRMAVISVVRGYLHARAGIAATSLTHEQVLARPIADRGPMFAGLWNGGVERCSAYGQGATLWLAARSVGATLRRKGCRDDGVAARLYIEVIASRGPFITWPTALASLSLSPGLEGLGVELTASNGAVNEVYLRPGELADLGLLGVATPLDFVPDLRVGLDFERADMYLAKKAALGPGGYKARRRRYFRFRSHVFIEPPVESPRRTPLALLRGQPDAPQVSAASVRAAGVAAARFLVSQLTQSGRYIYETSLVAGGAASPGSRYSIPRHAGTTYFLAEALRITGEGFLREPVERALAHLADLVDQGGCAGRTEGGRPFRCVIDSGRRIAVLGSTALAVVALAEYERATDDHRYRELATALTEWILHMQRPDGSFRHLYDVRRKRALQRGEYLYFSGEAALSLTRMHAVTGDRRLNEAAERALDHLVGWYDFFVGRFFYGEEHWTCLAAEAAWPALQKRSYVDFCTGYAAFLREQQLAPSDFPAHRDLFGGYSVTPFFAPQTTPAGSRTEAMISTYVLGQRHGLSLPLVDLQIRAALRFLLAQQVRESNNWAVNPGLFRGGIGAVTASPIDRTVRIDYVQHVGSAMIRAAELLESIE